MLFATLLGGGAWAQMAGSNDGLERLLGGSEPGDPRKLQAGRYRQDQAEVVDPSSEPKGKSPLVTGAYLRLLSEGQEQACIAELARPVSQGEHLRISLKARHLEGEQLQFGLGGKTVRGFLALKADGAAVWYDGEKYHALDHFRHKSAEWQLYAIDYVAGADQAVVTAGRKQIALPVKVMETVETAFVETGEGTGMGDFAELEAFLVLEPEIKALPVFGSITWSRSEMPFVSKGPKGGVSGAGCAAAGGKVYQMGGFIPAGDGSGDEDQRTSKGVHSYDPATGVWSKLPDLPQRREYGKATASGHDIYFVGGGKQRPYQPHADVFHLDTSSDHPAWTALPPLQIPRTHTVVGAADGFLIVAGGNEYDAKVKGYHPSTIRKDTEVLDLKALEKGWKRGAPLPGPARGWSAPVVVDGKLYAFGGVTYAPKHPDGTGVTNYRFAETLVYNPKEDRWTTGTPAPVSFGGWNGALYKDRYVILIGGVCKASHSPVNRWNSTPLVYDTKEDQWLRMESSHTPPGGVYNDPGVAIIGNKIYVAGGEAISAHYNTFLTGTIQEK